jgi:actin-like ATPase involved in cell morphogenesis
MSYQVGVDLGTTFTAAAVARDGRVEIAELGTRSTLIPSVVYIGADGQVLVGEAAWRRRLTETDRVAREIKRHLGDDDLMHLGGVPHSAEYLLGMLLRGVVDVVAAIEGAPAERVVMTRPAAWDALFRSDLLAAVRFAEVQAKIITEPEAAATYYDSKHRLEVGQILTVYSLGGGRFEATVLRKTEMGFETLGRPEGIDRVGGIDDAVFDYVVRQVGGLSDLDTTDALTATALARLRDECVTAKEALSHETDVSIPVVLPGVLREVRLSRADFEAMVRPLLEETTAALGRVLQSAALAPTDLSAVLPVGGSTRIPLVRQLVSNALGRPINILEQPDHAVALGAALVAAKDARTAKGLPLSAGIARPGRRQLQLDDDVQFTVYRPSQVQPDRWYPLLAFAHRTTLIEDADGRVVDPVQVVERQSRALLGDERVSFDSVRADARAGLARGSELRFQPWLEQGEVNPASALVKWQEPVHRAEFRILLPPAAEGRSIRGGVRVFLGVVIIAEVPFRLHVVSTAPATPKPDAATAARRYRQIFASYSHDDAPVVEAVAAYVSVTGDRYLIDVQNLRSGQEWKPELKALIQQADIFQLFWSQNSMRSQFVRQEWEYALALNRDEFVRPVYWDDDIPQDDTLGLPPDALLALHFSKLAVDLPRPVLPPAPARSYHDQLTDLVDRGDLRLSDQLHVLRALKQLINEEGQREHAVALLRRLRHNPAVYARVAEEIDIELSKPEPPPRPVSRWSHELPDQPVPAPTPRGPAPAAEPPPGSRSYWPPLSAGSDSMQPPPMPQTAHSAPPRRLPSGELYPDVRVAGRRRIPILIAIVVVLVIITLLVAFLR